MNTTYHIAYRSWNATEYLVRNLKDMMQARQVARKASAHPAMSGKLICLVSSQHGTVETFRNGESTR